jgi:transitional endoplasmic reticulum ATPase
MKTSLLAASGAQAAPSGQPQLAPVQSDALARLLELVTVAPITGFIYHSGTGGSTVLRALVERTGGCLFNAQDYTRLTVGQPPEQFGDLLLQATERALLESPVLVLDELGTVTNSSMMSGARPGAVRLVLKNLARVAADTGHALVISSALLESWEDAQEKFGNSAVVIQMQPFGPDDYAQLAENIVGRERAAGIDFRVVHSNAAQLNAWQLVRALEQLPGDTPLQTLDLLSWLAENGAASNTRTQEVEALEADRLPGHEAILDALHTHVVLAMEHPELAHRLGIRSKRGVLLFGPPGTGKTSIGRVLARQIKGRFFLIDGSIVSEPAYRFYAKLEAIIAEARKNAPSVLFIDDADALFGIEHIAGLTRYLLTLLDGLQNGRSNQVCVMMTAMSVEPLPAALLRSGRVELWLETRLPDAATRAKMLQVWLDDSLPGHEDLDCTPAAQRTDGFTPADLRRVTGDAKILYAADIAAGRPERHASEYLLKAIDSIEEMRRRLAAGSHQEHLSLESL